MILLDTCVLLWLAADPSALSPAAVNLFQEGQEALFVSAISAFEVGQKVAAGKISLPLPVDEWFPAMLDHHGLRELPVTGLIAARATRLPPVHRDPFDRLLIATARQHQLALLTPDKTIATYPDLHTVW